MTACAGSPSTFVESRGRVIFGVIVMVVGAILLAERFDWWGHHVRVPFWPWILVFMGLARWHGASEAGRPVSRTALWFIAIGVWGLVTESHLSGFGFRRGWPFLVLIVGVFMVWRALDHEGHHRERSERS